MGLAEELCSGSGHLSGDVTSQQGSAHGGDKVRM